MTLPSAGRGRHPDGVEDGSFRMTSRLVPPRLMLLTDRAQLSLGRGLVTTVRECVDAGLTWVVVREHDLGPAARVEEVRAAAAEGAVWATLSPYAETASKPGYGPALGPGAFAEDDLPVFALGGIDAGNAAEARLAGAYGVAVMGAVMRAHDPAGVVRDLLAAVGA